MATPPPKHGQPAQAHNAATYQPHTAVAELLKHLPFLAGLSQTEVDDVLRSTTDFMPIPANSVLTVQGQEAEYVYYLVHGQVRLEQTLPSPVDPDQRLTIIDRSAGPGTLIGRYALIYNLPYTSQATTQTDVLVMRFRTSALERLLYRFPELRGRIVPEAIINRLRTLPLFRDIDLVTLSYLADDVKIEKRAAKEIIYTQEREAESLYLIDTGQVNVYHPRLAQRRLWLGSGGAFGFAGSIGPGAGSDMRYGHWAETTAATVLYKLPWRNVQRLAHWYPHILDYRIQFWPFETLREVPVFAKFSDEQRRKLAGYCTFQHIPQHHLLLQQGDIGDSMWILLAGSKAIISALDPNARALPRIPVDGVVFFHEMALRAARNVRSTVEAEPGSLWLRLHWQDFRRFTSDEAGLQHKLNIQIPEDKTLENANLKQDYSDLGQGEVLVSYNHRHWIALLDKLKWPVAVFGASLIAYVILLNVLANWWIWWATPLALIVIFFFMWGILDYYNDYFIVTNQRVIQQEKVILTTEYRREALLEQIERVDVQTSFWGNVLKYGTLKIYTAGTTGFIEFDLVPNPDGLKAIIFRESNLRKLRYRAESKLEIQNSLEQRLGKTMSFPSRVFASESGQRGAEPSMSGWRRFWRSMRTRELKHVTADRVVWRKHWLILLREVTVPFLLMLFLLIFMLLMLLTNTIQVLDQFQQLIIGIELVLIFPFLLLFGWVIYIVVNWWNDYYELTKDRIVDVEKLPFFLREVRREAQLAQIQDVTYRISSPIEMLFNYGNVVVQTAASQGALTFDGIPDPRGVKEEINRRVVEWRRQDELRKARDQIRDLPDWFELYNRLEAGRTRDM